ncbi:Major Facilitator Superfamily protein [Aspergillus niger]|uniref:Major Facilitator Superfamily protein n=1 Tax=Aspergillus niger TaxID=5061 RepID=A0A505IES5_ASPNG|nr:Major Facilitator Superfamily protein [Aspergillus niger]
MAYPDFHRIDPELEELDASANHGPVFHDTERSPVYEDHSQGLIYPIVAQDDVAALRRYHANPGARVFWEAYENPSCHPFFVAQANSSCETLQDLLQIYLADYLLTAGTAKKYEYHPAGAGDLRSPCPVLNALANHGIISRDGRNITASQLKDALKHIGVGIDIRLGLVNSAYAVHDEHSHRGLRNPEQPHLNQLDAARHLISRGADVNMADYVGNTPLHEVMKGTMLKRYDNNGNLDPTYPWDAPLRGRQQWIQVLVEAGGLMQQPNASGQTPAQLLT